MPGTKVRYRPLLDMKHAGPSIMLTIIHEAQDLTTAFIQDYTILSNDQQLYKITEGIRFWDPKTFEKFVNRLGSMHKLMCFVGSVGTLLADSGLEEVQAQPLVE